jgi:hypothetical protein
MIQFKAPVKELQLSAIVKQGMAHLLTKIYIMAKSQATFMKKQLEKNRQKKKEDKEQRKLERQQNAGGSDLDSMMAYVNEFGEITSTPPEKK